MKFRIRSALNLFRIFAFPSRVFVEISLLILNQEAALAFGAQAFRVVISKIVSKLNSFDYR